MKMSLALFNLAEALLWFLMALLLGVRAFADQNRTGLRTVLLSLAGFLVLFGLSDLIEMQTGAWWRPLWLLLLKAFCLLGLCLCARSYYLLKKK